MLSNKELFHWPIVTDEEVEAVAEVMRDGAAPSGTNITRQFEREFAAWHGVKYGLGTCNGTAALNAAFWACGVGAGDEVIAPAVTYWASCAGVVRLGAKVVFADVDPATLCIDPEEVERLVTPRTRALIVVNYGAMPADWDRLLPIVRRHGIRVIEDNSHAQGSRYKGRLCGTFGDISAASLMSGKAFAIGEGGILLTDDRELYERCAAYGHYERTGAASRFNPATADVTLPELTAYRGIALGGVKDRMNQMCSARGLIQLKYYAERIAEIGRAMEFFCDGLDRIPGLKSIRPEPGSGSDKGGWYFPLGRFDRAAFGGRSVKEFAAHVTETGVYRCMAGANVPLHRHPYFSTFDFFHQGKPTAEAFGIPGPRADERPLPVAEATADEVFQLPWFKRFDREAIQHYVDGIARAAEVLR